MKKLHIINNYLRGLAAGLAVLSCAVTASAHPYASGITNNSGTISYILNEAATSVSITLTNNGTGQTATIAGGTTRGVNSFSLTQSSVTYANYAISVQKNGTGAFAPTGPDFTADIFNGPRAVAVNMNPKTHNFGRIYVVNASPGTATPIPPGDTTRTMGKGVFVVNADGSDADGYAGTAYPLPASWPATATNSTGTGWGSSTTTAPFKIFVGPDDNVYVADATSSTTGLTCGGSVWIMDPDLLHPFPLLPFIGGASSASASAANAGPTTSRPFVTGSFAAGNLKLYCTQFNFTDGIGFNEIFQYNIIDTSTSQLPWTTAPDAVLPGLANEGWSAFDVVLPDIYLGPISGEWYESIERGGGNGVNGWVFDSTGNTVLWNSQENFSDGPNDAADPMTLALSCAVSPDEKFYAAVLSSGNIIVMSITNNGAGVYAPDLSTIVTNSTGLGGTARGIAFDAADNIVFDTGGDCVMRSYTLGLTTTCVTANDSTTQNGTFSFSTPATTVTVAATTSAAYKNQFAITGAGVNAPTPGTLTITRSSTSGGLTVNYAISGTAANGVDYSLSPAGTSVTFAPGQASTNILVNPIHTGVPEPTTTVILTVAGGVGYGTVAPNNAATVTISDDSSPAVSLGTTTYRTMYEPNKYDYSTCILNRLGNTNTTFTVSMTYGGAAAPADYVGPATVAVNPGDAQEIITNFAAGRIVSSASNSVVATASSGGGYTVSSPASATNWIIYDEQPQGKVLFADNFNTSSTNGSSSVGSNYTVLYASTDTTVTPNNYVVTIPYDYSANGIPPAPHTTDNSTLGAFLQADNPANGSAAGVNIYPVLSSFPGVNPAGFSGSFALRFDMFLIENGGTSISGTTEYALFGIDHSGNDTNWFDNSSSVAAGWNYDGLFYDVEADGASLGDYVLLSAPAQSTFNDPTNYGSASASTLTNIFKPNPWTTGIGYGGAPANQNTNASNPNFTGLTPSWATVEIDQIVTTTATNVLLKINNWPIIAYTNNTPATEAFTQGNIMLGYDDAYNGSGAAGAAVIYDNVSVTQLSMKITSIQSTAGTATLTFTWGLDEPASSFTLQSSTNAKGTYTDNAAAITRTGVGVYMVTVPTSGSAQFFRIRHK